MNTFSVFALLLCVAICSGAPAEAPTQKYTTKYDNINLDEIIHSKRLTGQYVKCLTDGTSCTPQGKELREMLPDALATTCSKCSEKQKQGAIKVIKALEKDHPEDWKKLLNKWDPDGKKMELFKKTYPDLFAEVFSHQ